MISVETLGFIEKFREMKEKEDLDNQLRIYYNEEIIRIHFLKKDFIFDYKVKDILEELLKKGTLVIINDYLGIKYEGDVIFFHRYLKKDEISELAKIYNCEEYDIHVHHKNYDKFINKLINLEVLHKDQHARRHGYLSWNLLLRFCKYY